MSEGYVKQSLLEAQSLLSAFLESNELLKKADQLVLELVELYRRGGNLFICGNGGSHCDAMHFAEEFTGRFRKDRRPLGALALGDPSHVTCVSNDMGFDQVFSRQLEGLGRKGDLLVALTTSGNSRNIALAIEKAKQKEIRTVVLSGKDGGKMKGLANLELIIPGKTSDRIQEMHIKLIHSAIEAVERQLFPENY
ncbi:MAG: SIS domain-containing protein [Proteobacteria bacterium]|nr:SIS domain-containing protein [Pseudomonadota bacterium]NDG26774.1 SIS domain-containing protein [Pseudomonadota bacterium]